MAKKVLITGVAGFIGSNLADRLLEAGFEVVGIDDLSYGLVEQVSPHVALHRFDIRSPEIERYFKGVDTVFHLAAKNCISDCQRDPVQTTSINVFGSVNVFNAACRAGVRKVIFAESSAVYEGATIFPTPENAEDPHSFYAVSKLATHLFAKSYREFYNLTFTALRYFNVYGPRQDFRRTDRPIMTEFILQLFTGIRPILYAGGKRTKDYIYVDDINDFHLRAIEDSRTDNQTYNLGTGKETSFAEVLNLTQKLLGTNLEPELQPALSGGVTRTLADITKATALGWRPKTTLDEGLQKSILYIQEYVLPKLEKKL